MSAEACRWDKIGERGRRRERQHRVHPVVGSDHLQAVAEDLGPHGSGGIDRACDGRDRRQQAAQSVLGPDVQNRDVQAGVAAGVGGEQADPVVIGHDPDPAARGHRLAGQQRGRVDQLADVARGDDASLPEQRLAGDRGRAAAAVCRPARWPASERPTSTVRTGMRGADAAG